MSEIKQKIKTAVKTMGTGPLFESSIELFKVLGYNTSRQSRLEQGDYPEFAQNFLDGNANIPDLNKFMLKTQTDKWQKIELLFQLTDAEMSTFTAGQFDNTIINAYLFFALELKSGHYTRTILADLTRQINKVFSMPVLLVIKHNHTMTIAMIKRRLHKKDISRDVLEKVTLIFGIDTDKPHRAHLEMLFDLSLEQLRTKHQVGNFVELQNAWQKTLDSSELNKKFFREIANWYFWAVENIEFPDNLEKNREIRNATAIIRLLTRLIFVWFIKEKAVVPEAFFQKQKLKQILKDFSQPEDAETCIFYKAILQNLFFATLSTEKDKRSFRTQNWKNGRNLDYNNPFVYRYESLVTDFKQWKALFADIPFLNGGLFENLDDKDILVDGFSEKKRNDLHVPDFLFFSPDHEIDLNQTFDTKGKKYRVRGVLEILNQYKFTLAENTPIEEEIALDPELLGKVFENLLANFNPETKTTARKQTGSFYTPREIVDYMVDQSLKAALLSLSGLKHCEQKLDLIFAYTEKEHSFSEDEVKALVGAVSKIKILDPACGSGAFPMGILHKLVFILNQLDPDNQIWCELQKKKVMKDTEKAYNLKESQERQDRIKEIEETFAFNTSDYGRKLFLIEYAIYGVDLQPIAIQIAKLRFFISLIVDQDMQNHDKIKPLPNLETKFVAANTLIGRKKEETARSMFDIEFENLNHKLKVIRHKHFNALNHRKKKKLQQQDQKIREKIVAQVAKKYGDTVRAEQLATWNPYDQNRFADFFDSEWMYGIQDGFDIVIGNPPYVQIQKFSGKQEQKDWINEKYQTFAKTGDIYSLFYEKGNRLLKEKGILAFITSNKWMRANYGKKTRKYFTENTNPLILIDFSGYKVFESATVDTNILISEKTIKPNHKPLLATTIKKDFTANTDLAHYVNQNSVDLDHLSEDSWIISTKAESAIKKRIETVGTPLKDWDVSINYGIKTGFNQAFIIDGPKKDELIACDPKSAEIIKPVLRGRDIKRYKVEFADLWLIFIPWHFPLHNDNSISGNSKIAEKAFQEEYPAIYNHLLRYKERLSKRNKAETGIRYEWYALQRCAASYYQEFEKEIIVWKAVGRNLTFALWGNNKFLTAPASFLFSKHNNKFLLGFLLSKFALYFILNNADRTGAGDVMLNIQSIANLPIPRISKSQQLPFEILVDGILFAKENNFETEANFFEAIIDGMVYDLYFEDEMKEAGCYIIDKVSEIIIKPFKTVKKLYELLINDEIICHGIADCDNIEVVQVINGL